MNTREFVDYYTSPIGILKIVLQNDKITSISFVSETGPILSHPVIDQCKQQLHDYFSGNLTEFSVPLNPCGTSFQQEVWKALLSVTYGKTVSYQDIANAMGRGNAVRAVAHAIGKNPILILIPCHRVIGSDGRLTGYVAGIDKKKKLLILESNFEKKLT